MIPSMTLQRRLFLAILTLNTLMLFSSRSSGQWNDTLAPAYQPSVPSTASGPVLYHYIFVAESTGDPGASGGPVASHLIGYTEEYATRSGTVIVDRGNDSSVYREKRSYCGSNNNSFTSSQASYSLVSGARVYSPNQSTYDAIKGGVSVYWSTSIQSITGGTLTTGTYSYLLNDNWVCGNTIQYVGGTCVYYEVSISLAQGATPPSLPSVGSGSDVNNVYYPTVTITVPDGNAKESPQDLGKLRISRAVSTSAALTVNFTTSGTATGPSPSQDYSLKASGNWVTSSASIPAGSSYVDVDVYPWYDGYSDPNETVILTLSASGNYTVGSPSSGTVVITD